MDSRTEGSSSSDPSEELPAAFFELILGRTPARGCAYFRRVDETLERAQRNALDLVCRKLRLEPGHVLLDVGCGFGSLILWAAKYYGVRAHGVTPSAADASYAAERIRHEGLDRVCRVLCGNPAELLGSGETFDRIAVLGAADLLPLPLDVPTPELVTTLLKEDGLYLENRVCSRSADGSGTRHAVDPRRAISDGLGDSACEILDVEQLRGHYALTCSQWSSRLFAERERALDIVSSGAYETALATVREAERASANGEIDVYQLVIAQQEFAATAAPFTREAIYAADSAGRSLRA